MKILVQEGETKRGEEIGKNEMNKRRCLRVENEIIQAWRGGNGGICWRCGI